MKTATKTAPKPKLSAAERLEVLTAEFTRLLPVGTEAELLRVQEQIDATKREVEDEAKAATDAAHRAIRVRNDRAQAEETRKLAAARAAGEGVDKGMILVTLDDVVLASVKVVPVLSLKDYQESSVHSGYAFNALRVLWENMARHAAARISNERARARGLAPTENESRAALAARLRSDLAVAIQACVVEVHG